MSGDGMIAHRLITVTCWLWLNAHWRLPMVPSGSMSASGQCPGVIPLVFDQLSAAVNSSEIELRPLVSQKSFT